ncbi:hypothetical protein AN641_03670 [Candidatus Epulonipiscioides gigas]|nr:hypothetical protein AN641_03670 [Epulopiscium sp. SCG-C07WGA-EpuloA2]
MALLEKYATLNVPRTLIKQYDLEVATLFAELLNKSEMLSQNDPNFDGWFDYLMADITANISITRYGQDKALELLSDIGFIAIKKEGMPQRKYFKIDFSAVINHFECL